MNILFDGRIFQFQKAGGINRYFAEVISGLPKTWTPMCAGVKDFGKNVPQHPNLKLENAPAFRRRRIQQQIEKRWWKPRLLKSVELLHPTYYDLTSGLRLSDFKCPVVCTVYDLIYARFPTQTGSGPEIVKDQINSITRADRIVCISESTERDLWEFFPETRGKTEVVYLGSSFPIVKPLKEQNVFEKPTFLYVGLREGYKNFLLLLRAFAKAASINPNIHLKVVGPAFSHEERWQIFYAGMEEKISPTGQIDETTLRALYQNSVALLFPSRYEGFGIPPLEAMACGTVAVTSNVTSLPEVVGDGGILLDPTDENAWTDCIVKLSRPFAERGALLARGQKQVAKFSWQECSRKHQSIYEKLGAGAKK